MALKIHRHLPLKITGLARLLTAVRSGVRKTNDSPT
jgi:hypothetical protein